MATSVFRDFDNYNDDDNDDKVEETVVVVRAPLSAITTTTAAAADIPYNFTPKYQHSIKNNPLCGICFSEWISLWIRYHTEIEYGTYWRRIIFLVCMSVLNSFLRFIERWWYGRAITNTSIHPRPVFILGHPRTGTTLLHSLLALDEDQFTICSTFCAGFPSCFLWLERMGGKYLFSGIMDKTRPMDNVQLHFDLPQEDELATCVMSGGISPYMPLYFMKQERNFRPYFAFDDDDNYDDDEVDNDNDNNDVGKRKNKNHDDEYLDPNVMADARKRWTESFLYLMKKLTLRDILNRRTQTRTTTQTQSTTTTPPQTQPRRLLLKSPVHTARIKLLLRLFPNAQFVYIHRHPYDVFVSSAHMADTTYWYTYLNTPTNDDIQEFIFRQYEILYDRYEEGRSLLRDDQLVEVSFDELSSNPIGTVQKIYTKLHWDDAMTEQYEKRLHEQLDDVQSYRKNHHQSIHTKPHLKQKIHERWGPSFQRFGYEMDDDNKQQPCRCR